MSGFEVGTGLEALVDDVLVLVLGCEVNGDLKAFGPGCVSISLRFDRGITGGPITGTIRCFDVALGTVASLNVLE